MDSRTTPLYLIREQLLEKRRNNPRYSNTSFARDIGVSASFLSRLLSGERPLTLNLAIQIAAALNLPDEVTETWIAELMLRPSSKTKAASRIQGKVLQKVTPKPKQPILNYEMARFKAISRWYHMAILNLTRVKDFKPNTIWIARRLGITTIEAQDAIARLFELGLLEKRDGTYKLTQNMFFVNQDKNDLCIKQFHQHMSDKAKVALQGAGSEQNDQYFSGVTLPFDRTRIKEFEEKLRQVSKEVMQMASGDEFTDVYHLNIQLFPITKKEPGV